MKRISLVAVVCLAACTDERYTGPMDGPMAAATVIGRVAGPDGQGMAGVGVVLEAKTLNSCANATMDRDSVVTSETGEFQATVRNWGTEFIVCARVRVFPGAAFAADSADRPSVRMHSLRPDTVRIDIVMRPSTAPRTPES